MTIQVLFFELPAQFQESIVVDVLHTGARRLFMMVVVGSINRY